MSETTKLPPLVGLTGKKRTGKDTFATALVENHGYTRVALADPLKEAAYALNPIIDAYDSDNSCGDPDCCGGPWPSIEEVRLAPIVDEIGWERAKDEYPEARVILQRLGTESIRALDDEFWVRIALARIAELRAAGKPVVVTDCRYPNEGDAIRDAGGIVVRMERDLPDDGDTHPSEVSMATYAVDAVVDNNHGVELLATSAEAINAFATTYKP